MPVQVFGLGTVDARVSSKIGFKVAGVLTELRAVVAAFGAGGLGANIVASKPVRRLDQRRLKRIFADFILILGLFTAARATGPFQYG